MFGWNDLPSEAIQDWIRESFVWSLGEGILRPDTPLVLPTAEFFPARKGVSDEEKIKGVVEDLQRILRLEDRQIEVRPREVLPDELRHQYGALSEIGGTWMADENSSVITYDPTLIRQPLALISVLAHEMMHERLSWRATDMPGGDEAEELSTDLHCFTAGLGVIQMAGAEQAGWQGYMRQSSRAYALALFLAVREIDPTAAEPALPSRTRRLLRRAVKAVARQDQHVAQLRAKMI